jgi:hypothetical protein
MSIDLMSVLLRHEESITTYCARRVAEARSNREQEALLSDAWHNLTREFGRRVLTAGKPCRWYEGHGVPWASDVARNTSSMDESCRQHHKSHIFRALRRGRNTLVSTYSPRRLVNYWPSISSDEAKRVHAVGQLGAVLFVVS